ncbi:MAG: hypothetical protein ABWU84_03305 [Pyrobaculum sp.]|uniref:hypothetical protein n=1 Tax=Pyrobaculum sp. TaxID=2004705 RepID=UPI003EE9CD33
MDFFLLLLFLEFLLNRTLNRLWIFVPHNPATYVLFQLIQWVGYVSMLALYLYSFFLFGRSGQRLLGALAVALAGLDLAHDYLGVGVKALFLLPAVSALYWRSKIACAYGAYYLVEGALKELGALAAQPYLEWAWALLPLTAGISRKALVKAVIASALTLTAVLASPYYMGMIFVFGLGLSQVLLLPLAVFAALYSKSKYSLYALLVGPSVQLSVHYLILSAAGYVDRRKQ